MQISSRFTLAIHIFACIDAFGDEYKITSDFLAGSTNVNPVIIRKILGQLKGAGLIEVARGTGGITVTRPLNEITFLNIYNAVECVEKGELFHFHENPSMDCPVGRNIHHILDDKLLRVQNALEKELAEITLADVKRDTEKFLREEKADILLEKLKADSAEYKEIETWAYSLEEKKNAIRSLMNIRMPGELSNELKDLQDRYLQEELKTKGVVALADIPTIKEQFNSKFPHAEKISLWQGDITRLEVGAIVNAANSQMLGCFVPCHRCIDNAIHSAAGMQLREECSHIMSRRRLKYGKKYEEPTGTATLTLSYNLPCDYVIHTVGPIVYDRLNDMLCQDLQKCYENVLKCCLEHHIKSVAFCCISTGEFRFPNDRAAEIAVKTITGFLEKHSDCMERIVFNVFKDSDWNIYEKILG